MDGRLFKGLDAEQKKKVKQSLQAADTQFKVIRDVLESELQSRRNILEAGDETKDPLAVQVARIQALKTCLNLLNVETIDKEI